MPTEQQSMTVYRNTAFNKLAPSELSLLQNVIKYELQSNGYKSSQEKGTRYQIKFAKLKTSNEVVFACSTGIEKKHVQQAIEKSLSFLRVMQQADDVLMDRHYQNKLTKTLAAKNYPSFVEMAAKAGLREIGPRRHKETVNEFEQLEKLANMLIQNNNPLDGRGYTALFENLTPLSLLVDSDRQDKIREDFIEDSEKGSSFRP
jgi:hypothetical protein